MSLKKRKEIQMNDADDEMNGRIDDDVNKSGQQIDGSIASNSKWTSREATESCCNAPESSNFTDKLGKSLNSPEIKDYFKVILKNVKCNGRTAVSRES